VASKVLEGGGDEDQFISALLHDSVEDQSETMSSGMSDIFFTGLITDKEEHDDADALFLPQIQQEEKSKEALELLRNIAKIFGSKVAYYVEQCTDSFTYPKKPWRQRKEDFIARCSLMPPEVKLIVACDKWHNLYSLYHDYRREGDVIWSQFNGKKEGTIWYYREVIHALKENWQHPILHELDYYFNHLKSQLDQSFGSDSI
jgi:(p)ppGpp synthase/HD superfamily hydrolase